MRIPQGQGVEDTSTRCQHSPCKLPSGALCGRHGLLRGLGVGGEKWEAAHVDMPVLKCMELHQGRAVTSMQFDGKMQL